MFVQIYRNFPAGIGIDNGPYAPVQFLLEMHPFDLANTIDQQWGMREIGVLPSITDICSFPGNDKPNNFIPDHLIYAYLIENTRIYEIFEKIIFEFCHGEKLGFPLQAGSYKWLRATEEIFYKNSSNYFIQSIVSNIRPDIRSSRRNVYYRMFGMDLNHGTGIAASYPYQKPSAANKDFVPLFEELLSEVWTGIVNARNWIGPDQTDAAKINDLIRLLRELLTTRKQNGNIYREEFFHVATMSWLHLTILVDNAPIVQNLAISAQSPAERLRQLGERVGYPAHPKTDAFFQMAENISKILNYIERGIVTAQDFYLQGGALRSDVENAITQWSIATGKDLKSLKTRQGTIGMTAQSARSGGSLKLLSTAIG
jgi:hypothetical protein